MENRKGGRGVALRTRGRRKSPSYFEGSAAEREEIGTELALVKAAAKGEAAPLEMNKIDDQLGDEL